MRNIFLKIPCFLLGINYRVLLRYDEASKRKVLVYFRALLIPVIIAFVSVYLLTTYVLNESSWKGIAAASIFCFLIFLVDSSFIMINTMNRSLGWTRLILALAIATIEGFVLHDIIFKSDIDNYVTEQQLQKQHLVRAQVQSKYSVTLDSLKSLLKSYRTDYDDYNERAKTESGKGKYSGKKGAGPLTEFYIRQRDRVYETHIMPLEVQKDSINKAVIAEVKKINDSEIANLGILNRIQATWTIATQDTINFVILLIFFLLFLGLETFVLILKLGAGKCLYEIHQERSAGIIRNPAL